MWWQVIDVITLEREGWQEVLISCCPHFIKTSSLSSSPPHTPWPKPNSAGDSLPALRAPGPGLLEKSSEVDKHVRIELCTLWLEFYERQVSVEAEASAFIHHLWAKLDDYDDDGGRTDGREAQYGFMPCCAWLAPFSFFFILSNSRKRNNAPAAADGEKFSLRVSEGGYGLPRHRIPSRPIIWFDGRTNSIRIIWG